MKKLIVVLFLASCDEIELKGCYVCETTTTQYYGGSFQQFKTLTDKCGLTSSEAREVEVAATSSNMTGNVGTRMFTKCNRK